MRSRLASELSRADVRVGTLRALEGAYEEDQDRHDPEVGDDALTFVRRRSDLRDLTDVPA